MNFKEISYWLNRHSRERNAGIQENQEVMDSCFRRNDRTLDCVVNKQTYGFSLQISRRFALGPMHHALCYRPGKFFTFHRHKIDIFTLLQCPDLLFLPVCEVKKSLIRRNGIRKGLETPTSYGNKWDSSFTPIRKHNLQSISCT